MSRSMMLGKALRNAIAGENAAAALYGSLSEHTVDPDARHFLAEMSQQEREHARAIELALDAEQGAELLYDTWADMFQGVLGEMFSRLAATEAQHAQNLERMRTQLSADELALDVTRDL